MDKKYIKSDDTELEEYKCYQCKSPIFINDVDINKIVVSLKFLFGKKYFNFFIGYKDSEKNRPCCILHTQKTIVKVIFIG